MRSFQQVIVLLFALFAFALAQADSASYDATVYVTSTIYRVNTVTRSGTPTPVANSTSSVPTTLSIPSSATGGNSTIAPSRTPSGSSTPSPFPGAASQLNVNFALAALAAVAGYMAL